MHPGANDQNSTTSTDLRAEFRELRTLATGIRLAAAQAWDAALENHLDGEFAAAAALRGLQRELLDMADDYDRQADAALDKHFGNETTA